MVNELNKIKVVSFYTFKEILKSKILINVFFLGLVLLGITFLASKFTYGAPEKTSLDIGMGLLFLSTIGLAIFFGVGLISTELETRTIYMIISRPISRISFLIGKITGLTMIMFLNTLILATLTILVYFMQGGDFQMLFAWSILFTFLESVVVLIMVVLLSLITNKNLTVFFSFALLFSGHAVDDAIVSKFAQSHPIVSKSLEIYHYILPGFYKFNLKDFLLYKQNLPLNYLFSHLFYGFIYIMALILFSSWLFERKDFD